VNESERREMVESYLRRLASELGDAPKEARQELVEDVRGHIEEAWAASPEQSRAALLNILERLGRPETLAREERERLGLERPPEQTSPDLLSVAAVVFTVLFWPIGVILAWLSPRWLIRDKAIATAIPVLGLLLVMSVSFVAFTSGPVTTGPPPAVQVVEQGQSPDAGRVEQRPSSDHVAQAESVTRQVENPLVALLGRALAFYGVLGAPLTSAIYLALRMGPNRRSWAVLLPVGAAVFVLFALLAIIFLPATVVTSG
jgi:uncharacterized membrane protein